MKSVLLLLLVLVTGCGQSLDHLESETLPQSNYIDPSVERHVEKFEATFNKSVSVSIQIKTELNNYCFGQPGCQVLTRLLGEAVDAVCWSSGGFGRRIEVRASRWDELGEQAQEQLLYHELGHCTLNQGHRNGNYPGTYCPNSIMNKYTFSKWQVNNCYLVEKDYYFSELSVYIP